MGSAFFDAGRRARSSCRGGGGFRSPGPKDTVLWFYAACVFGWIRSVRLWLAKPPDWQQSLRLRMNLIRRIR